MTAIDACQSAYTDQKRYRNLAGSGTVNGYTI